MMDPIAKLLTGALEHERKRRSALEIQNDRLHVQIADLESRLEKVNNLVERKDTVDMVNPDSTTVRTSILCG